MAQSQPLTFWVIPDLFFLYFHLFNKVANKKLLKAGFKPTSTGVEINHYANRANTNAQTVSLVLSTLSTRQIIMTFCIRIYYQIFVKIETY